jgi:hypothetical protein
MPCAAGVYFPLRTFCGVDRRRCSMSARSSCQESFRVTSTSGPVSRRDEGFGIPRIGCSLLAHRKQKQPRGCCGAAPNISQLGDEPVAHHR